MVWPLVLLAAATVLDWPSPLALLSPSSSLSLWLLLLSPPPSVLFSLARVVPPPIVVVV